MGLRIDDGVVIVDHGVNGHLVTTPEGNPTFEQLESLEIYSVFQRLFDSAKDSRDRAQKVRGDNFPLIYALKGLDGLTIPLSSLKRLNDSIPTILQAIAAELNGRFDVIGSMPSSSRLADMLAKRLSRVTGKPHITNLFVKATNSQAMSTVAGVLKTDPKSLPRGDEKSLRNAVQLLRESPNDAYTAKCVQTSIRHYFSPVELSQTPVGLEPGTRFLLVDDLLSTGQTLISADKKLTDAGFTADRLCVTWFSRAGKKKRS